MNEIGLLDKARSCEQFIDHVLALEGEILVVHHTTFIRRRETYDLMNLEWSQINSLRLEKSVLNVKDINLSLLF